VSSRDRAFFERLAPVFAEAETDEVPSDEVRRRRIAEINRARVAAGGEPLADEPPEPPELELYRRARALGHRSHRG